MRIVEVVTKAQQKEFVNFPKHLYKGDPFWVTPLDSQIEAVFDPQKNATFSRGVAIRYLLVDDRDKTIGRIAAFIDENRKTAYNHLTGGIGYFEVIEDYNAAKMLLDTAVSWLSDQGIEAVDGPINFGENDNDWGLLVEGFMQPTFGMPYNKKYYKDYLEKYGFRNYYDQYSYTRDLTSVNVFPERFMRIADWISKRPGYSFDHFRFKNASKYVNDVVEVYNATWSEFKEDFTPLEPELLFDTIRKTKSFLDEELVWFAYHNDKPIAFFLLYPDLNQILKELSGKLDPLSVIKFMAMKKSHKMTRVRAAAAGVHPKFQNSGVESAIFLQLYKAFKKKPWFKELELSWVGDFNPKMISIYEAVGAERAKIHTTYRYLIDRKQKFIRYKDELPANM